MVRQRLSKALQQLSGRYRAPARRRLAVALQGGGSHGAFTWGVLDRLLEDEDIVIDAASGASAGAVNAVVMASGLARDGRDGARAALARFWRQTSTRGSFSPLAESFVQPPFASAARLAFDLSSRLFSPYLTNPLGLNPLRDILAEMVDFEALRRAPPLRLLIAATHVGEGRTRLFHERELSLDAVLASTCLPLLHQAVAVDGEWYWDGGYTANPPLLPLIATSRAAHVLIVQLTPMRSGALPTASPQIVRRLNQITFNTPLVRELEALATLGTLYGRTMALLSPAARRLRRLRLHRIAAEDEYAALDSTSPMTLDWAFLTRLRDAGRSAADEWLAQAFGHKVETPALAGRDTAATCRTNPST
ncbi:patatin-like phospholipase family protein [Reyranella sp. CPCC 100927]|uniref:patatin-like phospholipase family protein n=1 Tax=Reyranella sp. CPCC 100927 TaxID=2599616 RepID=UPI0015B53CEE|nr:patatin-like phospholipase family protein [Reyranella sp. CPCC 100927]